MPTGARTAAAAADLYLEGEEEEENAIRKRRGALCVRPAESIAIECYNAWAREGPPASYSSHSENTANAWREPTTDRHVEVAVRTYRHVSMSQDVTHVFTLDYSLNRCQD